MQRFVEQRIARERAAQEKVQGVQSMLRENNILAGHGKSELRVETMRRQRESEGERRELFNDYTIVKQAQDGERKTRVAEMEHRVASELERRKAEKIREDQNRKRICATSEELKTLKTKLFAAGVNKERSAQLLEKQVRAENDRMQEKEMAEVMERDRLSAVEAEKRIVVGKVAQRETVKKINQDQIAFQEALRRQAHEEYVKEKEQVQGIVDKIADEDYQEQQARKQKQTETRAMLQQFMVEQEAKRKEMERQERMEMEELQEYARKKEEFEAKLQAEKEAIEAEKKRILNEMLGKAEEKNRAAEELEYLRNELYQEELEAEHQRREELGMRKKLEDRAEMLAAYEHQMQLKEEKKQLEQEEEGRFRAQLLAKFAEDDRIEQLNDQKRRMKIQEHKREVERLLNERRRLYEATRQAELEEAETAKVDEEKRLIMIEEERRRLLAEHATGLRDFLPKGTLEKQADLDILYQNA